MNEIETFITKEYLDGKSTYEIAESLKNAGINFYPNKVNRILKKVGIPLRDKSDSQKQVLSSGRSKHPTKGTKRSAETRLKISDAVSKSYDDPQVRKSREELSKKLWEKMTAEQKASLRESSAKAVRASSTEGSKIEKYLLYELKRAGYDVIFHSNTLIPNQKLQVDLYIPSIRTIIEVDGISHFEAIWGEENFQKTLRADSEKNGLCLQYFNVIRLQACAKKVTGAYCRKTLSRLMEKLHYIESEPSKLLSIEDRLIFIREN